MSGSFPGVSLIVRRTAAALLVTSLVGSTLVAQQAQPAPRPASPPPSDQVAPAGVKLPENYVIGVADVLSVVFWRDKDMTSDVVVRPDGMITLPLINDVRAAGLTPEQLKDKITEGASKLLEDPSVTVVVKQINSRKVFVTGEVNKPGPYDLTAPTSVMQLIALAGGLKDYAKRNKIVVLRSENNTQTTHPFDYQKVIAGKNLEQNMLLQPGDTVVVP